MAVQVIQKKTCDPHSDRGEDNVEAETTPPITIGKTGPRELEMCPVCVKELLQPLVELLEEHGRDAGSLKPAQPKRRVVNRPTPMDCPYCGEEKASVGFVNKHIDYKHPGQPHVPRPDGASSSTTRTSADTYGCPEGDIEPTTNGGAFASHMRRRHPELVAALAPGVSVSTLAV